MGSARNAPATLFRSQAVIADPGNAKTIVIDKSPCICDLTSTTTETRTVDRPTRVGAELILHGKSISGTITVTVTGGWNETGDTTFTVTEAGQFYILRSLQTSAGVYFWRLTSHYGHGNMSTTEAAALNGLTATVTELNARAAAASRLVNVTDAATYTVLAANSGKTHIMPDFAASCTLALPAGALGLEYTFIGKAGAADAHSWIFQVAESGVSFLGGLAFVDTDDPADSIVAVYPNGSSNDFMTILAPGGGTIVYMIHDGTNWIVSGRVNGATAPTFSDS